MIIDLATDEIVIDSESDTEHQDAKHESSTDFDSGFAGGALPGPAQRNDEMIIDLDTDEIVIDSEPDTEHQDAQHDASQPVTPSSSPATRPGSKKARRLG